METRVPKKEKAICREEALAKLAYRYFNSHGPAILQDFTWWSGLAVKDVKKGLDAIQSKMESETIEGNTYWSSALALVSGRPTAGLLVLPA